MTALAQWLRDRGWRARPETFMGESMFIAYAVAAGLEQLGLNGQLLTPHAGSRCRINVELVAEAVDAATVAGRPVATSDDAAATLGLPRRATDPAPTSL
jgi:uncharacterized protein (DUF849 family)